MISKIFADFNNADAKGRIRLNSIGTQEDLIKKNIKLKDGLELSLDDDDGFTINGVAEFLLDENILGRQNQLEKLLNGFK